ncbi:MAG: 2Fe-2S iron-sulfur cluster-binding protein [Candidatus Krumholzibacteria bacterium]|nr:2Fe-2S iron-sulfur cluster-binding protein [Candidatus Krumholzibacteria bacterium]MDP6668479.1 2Fe-2S iron-sulfur cluster-binding protein [Candidatus Krumholzibacteria bacterium]MDP6797373.1 2Fe-2S iron-sulfur cluster-binding protein [Candidatus Krumholzibacteria bacterium]MDP7021572.1 2Fe-2S iron-sulfur cluster-binding protein [Candidatus Krumholzibacteria bacterium]
MARVLFLPDNIEVEIEEGDSILDAAESFDLPLSHKCEGKGRCGTCHVILEEGLDEVPEMSPEEEDTLDGVPDLSLQSRLACQAKPRGAIVVSIPESSRED